jgi:hypothetical protein
MACVSGSISETPPERHTKQLARQSYRVAGRTLTLIQAFTSLVVALTALLNLWLQVSGQW